MKHFRSLLKLKEEGALSYSMLPKELIKMLLDEGLIEIQQLSANKRRVVAKEQFYPYFDEQEAIEQAQTRSELAA